MASTPQFTPEYIQKINELNELEYIEPPRDLDFKCLDEDGETVSVDTICVKTFWFSERFHLLLTTQTGVIISKIFSEKKDMYFWLNNPSL